MAEVAGADLAGCAAVEQAGGIERRHVGERLQVAAQHALHAEVDREGGRQHHDAHQEADHDGDTAPLRATGLSRGAAPQIEGQGSHEEIPETAV